MWLGQHFSACLQREPRAVCRRGAEVVDRDSGIPQLSPEAATLQGGQGGAPGPEGIQERG